MLIDTNVYIGPWPFGHLPARSGAQWAAHWRAHGITRAFVSHLGAVFQPDPMPANQELFAAARHMPACIPVPILNPSLANWGEQLDLCCQAVSRLVAIRLLPSYHGYSFAAPRFNAFVKEVQSRKLPLILGIRLDDRRHRHFALRIKDVSVSTLDNFLGIHPELHPLISGIDIFELRALAKLRNNFSVELSFIERLNSVENLAQEFSPTRIMFGSNTLFFVTQASIAKLKTAHLSKKVRAALAYGNATHFFSL